MATAQRRDAHPRGARPRSSRPALLSAARDVFDEFGYADASVAEVVRRADASIGSLYHHFGGKAGLYLALYEEYQSRQEGRASEAVAAARSSGERRPVQLFLAGAGAFLRGCWQDRQVARIFLDGDLPPGFGETRRHRDSEWIRQNAILLGTRDTLAGRALTVTVTAVIGDAAREIVMSDTARRAALLRAEFLRLLQTLLDAELGG